MSTKVSALTAATNAELTDDALAYVVTDPSGTPASKKSTLAKVGALPKSWLDRVEQICGAWPAVSNADGTGGVFFVAARSGQSCTGVRFYWAENAIRTVKCSLWLVSSGARLASVNVNTSGSAGYFTGTFASAQSLTTSEQYVVGIWETSGTKVPEGSTPSTNPSGNRLIQANAAPIYFRDYAIISGAYYAGAGGDNRPNSNTFVENKIYPVEPVVSG